MLKCDIDPGRCEISELLQRNSFVTLVDARNKADYEESHVITAKRAPKDKEGNFKLTYDAELECKEHVIVYDGRTTTLKETTDATKYAAFLWGMGSRNAVKILQGGYEAFSALYPCLRTQKIIYMPRELDSLKTYPVEIIPSLLYLGNWRQGNAPYIQKDLKIKAHVNCTMEQDTFFKDEGPHLMNIDVEDNADADVSNKFAPACQFIANSLNSGKVVLVYSDLGISRGAAIVMAYIIHAQKKSLAEAYQHLIHCSPYARPNRTFIQQLSQWEEEVTGSRSTDISDPKY